MPRSTILSTISGRSGRYRAQNKSTGTGSGAGRRHRSPTSSGDTELPEELSMGIGSEQRRRERKPRIEVLFAGQQVEAALDLLRIPLRAFDASAQSFVQPTTTHQPHSQRQQSASC